MTGTVGGDTQQDPCAAESRHVPAVFDQLGTEAGVLGEVVLQVDTLDVRDVHHCQTKQVRADAAGLDEVVGSLPDVQQHEAVAPGPWLHRHGPALPLVALTRLEGELHLVGVEAPQVSDDGLIGAPGQSQMAGLDLDGVGAHGGLGIPGQQQKRQSLANERRAQEGRNHPRRGHTRKQAAHALQAPPFHEPSVVDFLAAEGRLFDEAAGQAG